MGSSVKKVKQPWWHITKTESRAFWVGGLWAVGALGGWAGVATGNREFLRLVVAVLFTLLAAAYLTSGLARRHLSAQTPEK